MKAKTPTLAMPGAMSGIMMRRSTVTGPAPSMMAASSISFGTSAKKERSIQMEKGSAKVKLMTMRAGSVSISPSFANMPKSGMRTTMLGKA